MTKDDECDQLHHELERTRAWLEELAGELHVLRHSSHGREDRFWNCTHYPCPKLASFLRGLTRFRCRAREAGSAGGNIPPDCDWPWCGCYPEATKVLEAVEESGRFLDRQKVEDRMLKLEAQVFRMARWLLIEKRIAQEVVDDPGMMGDCFRQRVAEIDGLLDGSAGGAYLVDLLAERDRLRQEVEALRVRPAAEPGA